MNNEPAKAPASAFAEAVGRRACAGRVLCVKLAHEAAVARRQEPAGAQLGEAVGKVSVVLLSQVVFVACVGPEDSNIVRSSRPAGVSDDGPRWRSLTCWIRRLYKKQSPY